MPIPVHPNFYYVIIDFASGSALDAKHWSNTLYFENEGAVVDLPTAADQIQVLLDKFWNQVNAPGTAKLNSFLSKWVDHAGGNIKYKTYDLGQAAPRTPDIHTVSWPSVGASAMPNECAAVLSYRGDNGTSQGGTLNPNRRGRMYIGPLSQGAMIDGSSSHPDQLLSTGLVNAMRGAADYLRDQSDNDMVWQQYSRFEDEFNPVEGGFVENAFDTQRRRGLGPTTRFVW